MMSRLNPFYQKKYYASRSSFHLKALCPFRKPMHKFFKFIFVFYNRAAILVTVFEPSKPMRTGMNRSSLAKNRFVLYYF